MQERISAVLMRGGTSKGLFFHGKDLPEAPAVRDRAILAAYGSPDPYRRQMNGVGGATSVSSKTAIIGPSAQAGHDVDYYFGQVSIDQPKIEFKGNCGNLSAAVGPFAVDEGLVAASAPVTTVRIFQRNTGKTIIAEVPVREGRFDEEGDYAISGVPGTGSRIVLRFLEPGGSLTGRLLPTGHVRDELEIPGLGRVEVSMVDAANPVVFVEAARLGLAGNEIEEFDAAPTRAKLEAIRSRAAVVIGLAASPEEATRISQAVPKMAVVSRPQSYRATDGQTVAAESIDLTARIMSMGQLHRSYAVTGGICTVGAAMIPGTVVNQMLGQERRPTETIMLGHPGGTMEIGAVLERTGAGFEYRQAVLGRTARRLMEGRVLVPTRCLKGS